MKKRSTLRAGLGSVLWLVPLVLVTACTYSTMNRACLAAGPYAQSSAYARDVVTTEKPNSKACTNVLDGQGGRWQGHVTVATDSTAYCRYTWVGAGLPDLSVLKPLGRYEIDFPVVSSAGLDALNTEFQAQYRQQAGRVAYTTDVTAAPRSPVWVAVIDSAAHSYTDSSPDRFGHGRAVGVVVHDLSCGDLADKDCGLHIENTLAMPQVDENTLDYAHGGYFGSRMQLADALEATLAAWNKARAETKAKLIINLSLGWDQSLHERYPAPNATDAVKVTLQRAACSGAVIFAAAGNKNPGSKVGALYPALWEQEAAPDAATCRRVGIVVDEQEKPNKRVTTRAAAKAGNDLYAPLLYAVGGVDQFDVPLITTRVGGQARLTAYGLALVTDDVRPTVAYTGSSMATAVMSGAAAAAWSYAPQLSPAELVAKLYDAGNVVDPSYGVTSVCLGGAACHAHAVRRISVCSGLVAVGVTSTCTPPGAMPGAPVPAGSPGPIACVGPSCPPTPSSVSVTEPWVNPQPGVPLCPSCKIDKTALTITGTLSTAGSDSRYMYVMRYSGIYEVAADGAWRTPGTSSVNMALSPEYPGYPTTQGDISLWLYLGATWVWIGSQQVPVQ